MREEKLPECVAEGSHEDSEEGQDGTCSKGSAKVSGIGQTTGKGTNEEQGGNLDGADPDDLACGIGKMVGVVGLEDAKGAIVSPEVGQYCLFSMRVQSGDSYHELSIMIWPAMARLLALLYL